MLNYINKDVIKMKYGVTLHEKEDKALTTILTCSWIIRWIFLFLGLPLFILLTVVICSVVFSGILTLLGL